VTRTKPMKRQWRREPRIAHSIPLFLRRRSESTERANYPKDERKEQIKRNSHAKIREEPKAIQRVTLTKKEKGPPILLFSYKRNGRPLFFPHSPPPLLKQTRDIPPHPSFHFDSRAPADIPIDSLPLIILVLCWCDRLNEVLSLSTATLLPPPHSS